MRRQISLRLDEELLAKIDQERKLIPRNAWIVFLLWEAIRKKESDAQHAA